jgi:hypothetical protein
VYVSKLRKYRTHDSIPLCRKQHEGDSMEIMRKSSFINEKIPSRQTPLRNLVESIPARYWSLFNGIRLDRKLGFKTAMRFSNLHQLT